MKVLHLIADISRKSGGPAKSIFFIADYLFEKKIDVEIATTDYNITINEINNIKNNKLYPIHFFKCDYPKAWKRSKGLKEFLNKNISSFDVIHMHSMYLYHNYIGYIYAKKLDIPIIIRPHGTLDPVIQNKLNFSRFIMKILFQNKLNKHAKLFHFTSEIEKKICVSRDIKNKSVIIPTPLNLENYFNKKFTKNITLANDLEKKTRNKFTFIFYGRLNYKKGIKLLLFSFKKVLSENKNLVLLFVGPDEGEKKYINKFINENNLHNEIFIYGIQKNPYDFFNVSDYFVLPSESENFGLAVFEALAFGLPVIVSNKVSIHADITKYKIGFVCENNSLSLSKSMKSALLSKFSNISNIFKKLYEEKYNASKSTKLLIDNYEKIILKK